MRPRQLFFDFACTCAGECEGCCCDSSSEDWGAHGWEESVCTCLKEDECDCEDPEGEGVCLVSNECPVHNLYPDPNPACPVHG